MKKIFQRIFGNISTVDVNIKHPIRIIKDGISQSFVSQEKYDLLAINNMIDNNTRYNII